MVITAGESPKLDVVKLEHIFKTMKVCYLLSLLFDYVLTIYELHYELHRQLQVKMSRACP